MIKPTRLKNPALHRWIPTVLLILLAAGSATVLRQLETEEEIARGKAGHTPDCNPGTQIVIHLRKLLSGR